MTYCNLEFQGHRKKIKVEDDDANHTHNQEQKVVCRDFWNEAPEELLIQIFIRQPDCRSAVRTSTVCRRWHSLISRNPQFIQKFKSHHHQRQDRYPTVFPPWAIMFRNTDIYEDHIPKPQHFRSICQLYSEEWMFLHGKLPANCLDFLPSPMLIKASCNDLLFVSNGSRYTDDHYICNPITKQFIQLPVNPRLEHPCIYRPGAIGYALLPMPALGATSITQFKVVEVLPPYDYPLPLEPDHRRVQVSIFCSESRKWEIRHFPCPRSNTNWNHFYYSIITACNEVLFWLGNSLESPRVVYLDLSKNKCGAVDTPSRIKILSNRIGTVRASGGVDELRLLQVLPLPTPYLEIVHLRVWRLNNNNHCNDDDDDDDSNWFLVHDKKLIRPKNLSQVLPFIGPFVHPTNGDLVFMIWGKTVIEYNLIDETYNKIGELLENVDWFGCVPFMIHCYGASNLPIDF